MLYRVGAVQISDGSVYKIQIAFRKIFRYIFHLLLRIHFSALLNAFVIVSIADLIYRKTEKLVEQCATCHFQDQHFLLNYIRYGL